MTHKMNKKCLLLLKMLGKFIYYFPVPTFNKLLDVGLLLFKNINRSMHGKMVPGFIEKMVDY